MADEKQLGSSTNQIAVGDLVLHNVLGEGIVIEKRNSNTFLVRFKGSRALVDKSDLQKEEMDILVDDEEETVDTSFITVPRNYSEQECYSKNAKLLLNHLKKKYKDGGMASIKSYSDSNGEIGVLVVPDKGIIVFKMINNIDESDIELLQSAETCKMFEKQYQDFRDYYFNRFYMSKLLCFTGERFKILKYPVRFVFLLENIDLARLPILDIDEIAISNKNILFKRFTSLFKEDLFSNFEAFETVNAPKIDSSCYGAVIERVIPENATLVDIASSKKPSKVTLPQYNPHFVKINGQEREFNALSLDDGQIKAINDTKPGYYLTLANPGTGKSVLLVSKAYRIQSINKGNVLITCFNNNLAQHHNTFAQISGMKTDRLRILTFHSFVFALLKEVSPSSFSEIDNSGADIEERFQKAFFELRERLPSRSITNNLDAIFIDEIQLFEPEWIDFCHRLLLQNKDRDHFFEMFGDINQDVKALKAKGKASWQLTKTFDTFRGRTKYLHTNYRNTDKIAYYLNSVISNLNSFLKSNGVEIDEESACLSSDCARKGKISPKKYTVRNGSFTRVTKLINELVNDPAIKAEYTDIAIIYPARQYLDLYNPIDAIENELNQAEIPFCYICGGLPLKKKIFDCDGVILTTVDSSMGLDFKYVIFCGLHYWDYVHIDGLKTAYSLRNLPQFNKRLFLSRIGEIGKCIYTACSRAREGLFIIDDLDIESPLKKIIWPEQKRD